jgi:dihydrofolate reductase
VRKVVAGLFISLDGVVEAPERWQGPYLDAELLALLAAGVAQADAILLGRQTYLQFAAYWPSRGSNTPMGRFLNDTRKHVASATLGDLEWANSSLLAGDLAEEVSNLRLQPGANIQVPGSPSLVRSLLREGLLDELGLMIHPVVVGTGMRLFDGTTDRASLALVDSTALASGVLSVTYRPTD